jgi:prepilin-type processing-associated H-X9-DG protein
MAENLVNPSNNPAALGAGSLLTMPLSAFLCPSDSPPPKDADRTARTNYRMCEGDNGMHWDYSTPATNLRGLFGYRTQCSLGAISDGLSNTILFSERCIGQDGADRLIKSGVVYEVIGGGIFSGATNPRWVGNRFVCSSQIGTANEYKSTLSVGELWGTGGWNVYNGYNYFTSFNTIFRPNGPSCMHRSGGQCGIFTATSSHSGGVNGALGDGSVRFVSETIDDGTAQNFAGNDVSGASPFGIWGALGSRDGGESVALP